MPSKSVLITGGAGFLGSHLAERCLELGWRVTLVDAFTDYYSEALKRMNLERVTSNANHSLVTGDLLELDLDSVVDGIDIVFHLAAQPGVRPSWEEFKLYTRHNVEVTQRLLQAARQVELESFVIASSSSIYGDAETLPTSEQAVPRPISPYGITKLATEHLARVYWTTHDVPAVCLRYFTVYGPRQRPDMAFNRVIASALADSPFTVYGDGRQTRDFTFVADAVEATIAAAQRGVPGAAYNVGGGSRRSMNSVLELLGELLGRPVECEYDERQPGDARDTAADITRAREELGWNPRTVFRDGLEAQLSWQRSILTGQEARS